MWDCVGCDINRAKFQLDRLRGIGDPGGRKSLSPTDWRNHRETFNTTGRARPLWWRSTIISQLRTDWTHRVGTLGSSLHCKYTYKQSQHRNRSAKNCVRAKSRCKCLVRRCLHHVPREHGSCFPENMTLHWCNWATLIFCAQFKLLDAFYSRIKRRLYCYVLFL